MRFGPLSKTDPKVHFKTVGLLTLIGYLLMHQPFVDVEGVGTYLALTLSIGLLFAFAVAPAFKRLNLARRDDAVPAERHLCDKVERHQWHDRLLALGEDGLCFVPLLLVGANPITAEVAAVAFAALHYPEYPVEHCVWKGFQAFAIAVVVLPYGLGSIAIGHLIARELACRVARLGFLQPVVSVSSDRMKRSEACLRRAPER